MVGPGGQAAGQLVDRGAELGGGHDAVGDAVALAVGRGDGVAEEHDLLGALGADDPRQQVAAAGVGDDPAGHEHLDEPGGVGHHHQVAGQHEVGAAARGGAVDRRDDRLLAVEDRGDEPLPAAAHHPGHVAERLVGRVGGRAGSGFWALPRPAPVQKCFSPAPVRTTARTPSVADSSSNTSARWSRMSGVSEFPASGRLSVTRAIGAVVLDADQLGDGHVVRHGWSPSEQEVVEDDAVGDGDVEAAGRAGHRDGDRGVGEVAERPRQAGALAAEQEERRSA